MKIDMSPEAITNRLKTMEQLWELSISLMNAEPLESSKKENSASILLKENKSERHLENI